MKQLTQKDFLEKAIKVHGNKYDYSNVIYISSKQKIKIICNTHGIFEQIPNSHLRGYGCAICTGRALPNKETIIRELERIHNNAYSYENFEIKRVKDKVIITCKEHGDFSQILADHKNGHGCPKCKNKKLSIIKSKNLEKVLKNFKITHGDKYDYSKVEYFSSTKKVKIECKEHGIFLQTPNDHQQGAGCPKCYSERKGVSLRKNFSDLINEFKIIHSDKYDYSQINNYKNNKQKLSIICKEHGIFKQSANTHLNGHGCPRCDLLSPLIRNDYLKICNKYDGMSHLYLIRCLKDEEEFFKVGIARSGVTNRYKDKNKFLYDYEILYEIKGEAGYIWDLEKQIHKLLKEFHYTPKIYFKGCVNECFSEIPAPIYKLFKKVDSVQIGLLA